ncbi:RDD family protein [Mucilaginibacter aurantiaciroseus]|uniref:RDD family protein n=1 Tax=Mucilaginibacter aurantiaciroseus TaxID=2949308 RepID=UPI003518732C
MIFRSVEPKPYIKLRIIATLIDYGIYLIFFVIYLYIFDENPEPGEASVTGIMALPLIMVWFIYFVIIESTSQATPGHDIVKLTLLIFSYTGFLL